jgi:hypothetical protein
MCLSPGLLSNLGASRRVLRLKRVCTGGALSGSDIDDVLRFLCANANLRNIFFLWRPLLPDVESRADFLITFNTAL